MAVQEDLKQLMGNLLGIAQLVIKEQGALTPFAVAMTDVGEVLHLAGEDGLEPVEAIDRLTRACQVSAQSGDYQATAIAYDVQVIRPDTGVEQDAVAVNFDHRDNASVIYCVPYAINNGEVEMSEPLTQQGENKMFSKQAGGGIIMP